MRGTVLYGPPDAHLEEREVPKIVGPTDAIIRVVATCVCGSDLRSHRSRRAMHERRSITTLLTA